MAMLSLHTVKAGELRLGEFESEGQLVFVISDLPVERNWKAARSLGERLDRCLEEGLRLSKAGLRSTG